MASLYAVGGPGPVAGTTVVSDAYTVTNAQGQTQEVVIDSAGNTFTIYETPAGNPAANTAVLQQRAAANLAILETWISNNPNGAVLTAGQTLTLAKIIDALGRLVLGETNALGGA